MIIPTYYKKALQNGMALLILAVARTADMSIPLKKPRILPSLFPFYGNTCFPENYLVYLSGNHLN